ncbi:high mobility group box domain containing protein [Entamoeba histolytica HM-1:IMSS-B]|uniref:High mobility group box domain containing protein n=6 Tax=Entamoeba TaxID=5758 RepID=M3UID8_ENTH1|nr:HMG (high mobility group) box domain containing protein [Entamoeba nuttalli P19]EMD49684.1 HMG (high mobility group) box domain containing protein, putative [Entamoeba histolytica KU27]EMH72741.1 high mobility group box domain containing protein [Entamoeba histolytica HM-1:IMSS-B]EMS16103.1 HMG (high mobility group) box domain containing protein [Entamoeba histolytica HM-3:IMSS]ENY63096.1 HMG (high mobility group) box domain containing protein [Entamoeba histolytica HM-1:IMSS-A]EKE40132.1 H|eukprot:XP_008857535.1 HMG (high mobility group) box domain containing protein [Entamoeba nuttalli P19]
MEDKTKTTTKPKTTDTTQKLKRPLSAYFLYSKDVRKSVVEANPTLKNTEIMKIIGEKWKGLSDQEKKKYNDLHDVAKKEYEKLKKEREM